MIELSVVIATYNRVSNLQTCLEALARQTAPTTAYEVIVVVDGSTDGTLAWLDRFHPRYALRVVAHENRGQCTALNRGAELARGRWVLFLDDDIVAEPELIAAHLRLQRDHLRAVGIGRLPMRLPGDAGWFEKSFAREWDAHYAALDAGREPTWQDCYGGNMSVAASDFLGVGGFDATLPRAYDIELAYRLMRSGCSFTYLSDARGVQDQTKCRRALLLDAERSGAACVELYRRHPSLLRPLLGMFGEQRQGIATLLRVLLAVDPTLGTLDHLDWIGRRLGSSEIPYQLLHRYAFWRGVHHAWADSETRPQLTRGTPILMYHAFGKPAERATRYVVPVDRFARQMAWLKTKHYRPISLENLLLYRATHQLPPTRSVVITIDDGYADTLMLAQPVLQRYQIPATVFTVTDRVGVRNDWDAQSELGGRALLSWAQLRALQAAGVGIGAHTRTHPDLSRHSATFRRAEIEGSRAALEQSLGVPIRTFAYPYGKHPSDVEEMVQQAGFDGACTIDNGLNTPATRGVALRRVEVFGSDSLFTFATALKFGTRPEALWRRVRGVRR